jgi:hypothetical protein
LLFCGTHIGRTAVQPNRLIGRISLSVTTDQQAAAWVSIFGDALAATLDWLNRQGEAIDTGNGSYRQTETT